YPLIYLAGDMKNMRSSLGAFLTPPLLTAVVIVPVAYLLLVWVSQRLVPLPRAHSSPIWRGIGLAFLLLYVGWGHHAYTTLPWCDRVDRRVAENPHWVLLKSLVTDWAGNGSRIQLHEDFPLEDLDDFAVAGERFLEGNQRGSAWNNPVAAYRTQA